MTNKVPTRPAGTSGSAVPRCDIPLGDGRVEHLREIAPQKKEPAHVADHRSWLQKLFS